MADETLEETKESGSDGGSPPGAEEEVKAEAPAEEKGKKRPGRPKKAKGRGAPRKKGEGTPEVRKRKQKEPAAEGEPPTPVERPSRERKTVERFASLTPPRSAAKGLSIQQGPGTKLKDIPNVFFKINKRKVDENLQHLHSILFSKRAKAYHLKKNIFQFSGFVWTENKEKQRAKVRERLEKCVKDKLLDFCETLDIPVNKTVMKKEDISVKLLEFLESPHVTRDVVLADKEQSSKKRKRKQKGAREAESGEKRKRGRKPSAKADNGDEKEMDVEGDSADDKDEEEDAPQQERDILKIKSEENIEPGEMSDNDEEDKPEIPVGKKASIVKKGSKLRDNEQVTPKKTSAAKTVKPSQSKEDSEVQRSAKNGRKQVVKSSSEEKPDAKVSTKKGASAAKEKDGKSKKQSKEASSKEKHEEKKASKSVAKKEQGKGKSSRKAAVHPTREEMHAVVSEILKEVDFNTATLADILRQLGEHFKMDLMDRKAEVKSIIEDVINSMTDDDGDDDDDEGDGDKENVKSE